MAIVRRVIAGKWPPRVLTQCNIASISLVPLLLIPSFVIIFCPARGREQIP